MRMTLGALLLMLPCACGATSQDAPTAANDTGTAGVLTGTLSFDGTCFYLADADGQSHLLVLLSPAVKVAGDSLVYKGEAFEPGDELRLPGGTEPVTGNNVDAVSVQECDQPDADVWIVR